MSVSKHVTITVTKTQDAVLASRRRAIDQSDGEVDDADAMDEEDQYEEHEGDNEPEGQAASSGNHTEPSTLLDGPLSKQDEAKQEVQRQRNLEQALHIQMEMQKKLHEQLEVASLLFLQLCHCISGPLHSRNTAQPIRLDLWCKVGCYMCISLPIACLCAQICCICSTQEAPPAHACCSAGCVTLVQKHEQLA